jgi:AcrR family transcriptional regulator
MIMNKERKDTARTRRLLLTAAYRVFFEKGFRDATIADICAAAGTNIASVNYHFGSKETLYREAWLHAFHESAEKNPIDGGVAEDAPPEDRLRGYIQAIIHRIVTEPSDLSILHMEMANPTGLLSEIVSEKIKSQFEVGKTIVRALLGEGAAEEQVVFCHESILGQCFHLGPSLKIHPGKIKAHSFIADIPRYCDHVIRFSLAGIRENKKAIEASEKGQESI